MDRDGVQWSSKGVGGLHEDGWVGGDGELEVLGKVQDCLKKTDVAFFRVLSVVEPHAEDDVCGREWAEQL